MRDLFGIFDERAVPAAADSLPVIAPPLPPSMLVNTSSDTSKPPSIDRRIDGIFSIQQLCGMAKHLQPPSRIGFFRSLAEQGVLKVIEFGLSKKPVPDDQQNQTTAPDRDDPLDDSAIKSAICEILITIIDYDPKSVRGYCLKQYLQRTRNLIECLIDLLLVEKDLGLKVQLAEAVRVLVDTGAGAGGGGMMQMQGGPELMRREEDPENERFLTFFYDVCMSQLAAPIFDLPEHKNAKGHTSPIEISGVDAAMYNHLCDLLCFFINHHSFRSKYVVLSSNIPAKVGCMLMFDRYKFVQLSALRFFRSILNKNDDYFNRSLIKHDLFIPVLDLLVRQGSRDNLLSSAGLEFFETIRLKNPKQVLNHLMERDATRIKQLSERLVTFKNLIARWEMNNEPPPPPPPPLASSSTATVVEDTGLHPLRNIGSWSRTRTLDAEEESYFNHDSDEESDEDHQKQESQISNMATHSVLPIAIPTIPSTLVKPIEITGSGSERGTSSGRKRHRSGSLVSGDGSLPSRTGGLTRSRTHSGLIPSSSSKSTKIEIPGVTSGAPLVDYDDDDDDEGEEETEQDKPEPPKRRKNEDDDDDEGVFGRLKRGSTPMIRSSGGSGSVGFTFPSASLTSTSTSSSSGGGNGKNQASKIVLSFGKSSSTGSGNSASNAEN